MGVRARGVVVCAAIACAAGCAAGGSVAGRAGGSSADRASVTAAAVSTAPDGRLARPLTYGAPEVGELTLTPPTAGDHPVVSESTAREQVDNPDGSPLTTGHVLLFALARVSAKGGSLSGTGTDPLPAYDSRLAWVGIYEVARTGGVHCPAEPYSPSSLPPLQPHYYFAVLIDASTGQQVGWQEDESGLTTRECAGLPVG